MRVGDFVTRNSYGNDIVFRVIKIDQNIATIKGEEFRLIADSPLYDLKKHEQKIKVRLPN